MSNRRTPLADKVPIKARHRVAWGAILGDSSYRGLPPRIGALDGAGPRGTREAAKTLRTSGLRDVGFAGSSGDDLRDFPLVARHRVGYQLHRVQSGRDPSDWTPMAMVGLGCKEIRVHDAADAYGVLYVASSAGTVNVLHCFHQRSGQATMIDLDAGEQRYKQVEELTFAGQAATTTRYDSVWDALADTPGATENLKIRSALMQELTAHIATAGMPQSDSAHRFGVTQPRIVDLLRGRIDAFTIDTLVNMLAAAGLHLDLRVREAP